MFKKLLTISVLLAAPFAVSGTVSAQSAPSYTYFCHRSNSATNPYQSVPFSQTYSEIDGQGNNDHTLHTGPVPNSVAEALQLKDQKINWGDIIPPVPGVLPTGMNWTSEGQDIWNNDCEFVEDENEEPVTGCDTLSASALTENEFQFTTVAVALNGPSIESYNYDFGDGNATGEVADTVVNHAYADPGTYNVVVTVTFNYGERQTTTDTCETTVTVEDEGDILGEETTATTTQVTTTPRGAVSAGVGSAGTSVAALVGLVTSIGALTYGLVRKFSA